MTPDGAGCVQIRIGDASCGGNGVGERADMPFAPNSMPHLAPSLIYEFFRDSVMVGRGAGPGHPLADANAATIVLQKRGCSARFRLDNYTSNTMYLSSL